VCWNLTGGQEAEVVWQLAGDHVVQRVPVADIEVDEFKVQRGGASQPIIQDDTISMSRAIYSARPPDRCHVNFRALSSRHPRTDAKVMSCMFEARSLQLATAIFISQISWKEWWSVHFANVESKCLDRVVEA
jgi:hypothetical protein